MLRLSRMPRRSRWLLQSGLRAANKSENPSKPWEYEALHSQPSFLPASKNSCFQWKFVRFFTEMPNFTRQ